MKVISHGNAKRNKPDIKFFCKKCGCLFVAGHEEYKVESTQIEGTWYYSKCPDCGASVSTQDPIIYTGE